MKSDFPHIPGYWIERELGRGAMGVVYLAHEGKLDRRVAVKVVELLNTQTGEQAERFINEARTAARLQHSNIVPIYDVGLEGNLYYMAVEYFPGGTLRDLLNAGPLPGSALLVVERLADALHYAHSLGFIHRDVKPENIMFRRDGTPVLSDFGIARAMDAMTRLTQAGKAIGTPHYMSPEQARGLDLDGRVDLYSLGVVFYEMLVGDVPYEAQDNIAVAIKHIQEPIPTLPPHLAHFQDLLRRMMAKDRAARVQTGEELSRLIQDLQSKEDLWPVPAVERGADRGDAEGDQQNGKTHGSENGILSRIKSKTKAKTETKPESKGYRRLKFLAAFLAGALVFTIALLFLSLPRRENGIIENPGDPSLESEAKIAEKPSILLDREYGNYMSKARAALDRGDFNDARMKVALAETIRKGSEDAGELKKLIDRAETAARRAETRKPDPRRLVPQPTRKIEPVKPEEAEEPDAEDAAWGIAAAVGTEESLNAYLRDYPAGRHSGDARQRLDDIRAKARISPETKQEEVLSEPPKPKTVRGDLVPLSAVDSEPLVVKSGQPAYPESLRRFRIEGTVVLEMLISETGEVVDIRILQGIEGYPVFEKAAESSVRKWRFRPASKDGVAVKVWKTQTFVFKTDR